MVCEIRVGILTHMHIYRWNVSIERPEGASAMGDSVQWNALMELNGSLECCPGFEPGACSL